MSATCVERASGSAWGGGAPGEKPAQRLTRRASLNAMALLLDYAAKMAVGLVVTPILVAGLGRSLFGVWEILGRLVGYMSVADGRPTDALRLVIANQQAIDDPELKRRSVGSALGVWLFFLPVLALAGVTLVWLSPALTKVAPEVHASIRLTCALLVVNFLLLQLVTLPEAVLHGMNLGYRRMGLQASLSLVGGGLSAGAVYLGAGLIGLAWAQVVLAALTGVLFWFLVKKYVPWFGIAKPTRAELRSFFGVSFWRLAADLIAKLLLASDVLILGLMTSSALVTTYVLTGYAGNTVIGMLSLTLGAIAPGLGGVIGAGQYGKATTLRREMLALSWLVVAASGSTILLWNRSFLHLWVGGQNYAGFSANLFLVLIMTQTVFIRGDAYVIDATLKLRGRVLVSAASAILSIALSLALTPLLGIDGLCLGLLGGRLVQTASYPFLVRSYLHRPRALDVGCLARPVLALSLLFATSAYLGERLLATRWLEWVIGVAATFVLTLGVALVMGLAAETRTVLIRRLRMIGLRGNG